MQFLIEKFINNLTPSQVDAFAKENGVILSDNELDFTYMFVKQNWQEIMSNPNSLNIDNYKEKYSVDNFPKIKKLLTEYLAKYQKFL